MDNSFRQLKNDLLAAASGSIVSKESGQIWDLAQRLFQVIIEIVKGNRDYTQNQ